MFHQLDVARSEEHTSELQSQSNLVCRLLLEKKNTSIAIIRALLGWLARKLTARVQLRVGPLYASPAGGILQMLAELIKLAFNDIFVPENFYAFLFITAPPTCLVLAASLVGLMPFAPGLQIANIEFGLPAFLAIITFFFFFK